MGYELEFFHQKLSIHKTHLKKKAHRLGASATLGGFYILPGCVAQVLRING